ncbi:hypothetical protein P170DRAFT_430056 [Aspergillus steynii IBT 23096]|uniref:Rhodopsin domain-containing protein n=1 Tax=Aspergillus steynii IBT 23096 TaxID=1392250 RepID=A0A2I2FU58_9EURO|nr:uncharacterized protein P170DRAFT_430056 [Aspergillus steynii IBT 23096]PLB44141.1 hypothetical protein P170DRAFT_430056 [Aspergillus steynii IBT 23096]
MTVENPYDKLYTVNLVTQCLCIPIVTIFVALRFIIRTYYKQFVVVEDTPVYGILRHRDMGNYGGGYPISDVSQSHQVLFRKFCYIATVLYCPMALLTKVALLSIIIRIFAPYKSKIIFIYVFLGCLGIYYTVAEVVKIRMCDPVPAYWDLRTNASCLDQRAALIADSVISVVSDLIILILPLPLTWSLQMSRNKKLRVVGMLSAGGLATAFSIYRLVLVLKDGNSADQTIMFTCVILSGNAEGGVGLICACLPTFNIVIRKLRSKAYSSNRYYQPESSVPLSKMKASAGKGFSMVSKGDHDFGCDQSHLITYAGTVDMGSSAGNGGSPDTTGIHIHKTVDVSQTVEVVDEEEQGRASSGSGSGHRRF